VQPSSDRLQAAESSERPQCGVWEMVQAVAPATERVTTCHGDHCLHGACHVQHRFTAPGHGGHCDSHCIHGTHHSDHGDGERPAGPESAAASAAGATAFTQRANLSGQPCRAMRECRARVVMSQVQGRVRSVYCSCQGLPTPASARPLVAATRSAEPQRRSSNAVSFPCVVELWSGCDARDSRWRQHGAAAYAFIRALTLPAEVHCHDRQALRPAGLGRRPRAYSGELGTMMHGNS
jgi:hypothetical protein